MKPLVLYCRWQRLRLLLRGRDDVSVWGELETEGGERRRFQYDLGNRELTLGQGEGVERWQLDEMGVATPVESPEA